MDSQQVFKLYLRREVCPVAEELGMLADRFDVEDVVRLVKHLTKDEPREIKFAFFLNSACQLIGYQELAVGSMNRVTWDARLLFASAILCGASQIIMAHNHPMSNSGRLSSGDVRSLKGLIPAAFALGIAIRDSIVVCGEKWSSAAEFGLMPNYEEVLKDAEKASEGGRS